jgi:hypothetical protein
MSVLSGFKDSLIFEIQKEFWNERGKGARYRLTMIGADFLGKLLTDPSDINEIVALYKKEGFCSAVEIAEDEFAVTMKVKDCAFADVSNGFMNKGQQPLSCPLANTIMRAIEIKSGLGPELLPIEASGGECVVGMGKVGTSEVLKR